MFPGGQLGHVLLSQSQLLDKRRGDRFFQALGDGGDAQLLVTGSADLASDGYLQRGAERLAIS